MSDEKKPSFIRIAPGAKVKGLEAIGNTMIGDGDFINNQGELEDAQLERNRHIIPANLDEKKTEYPGGVTWVDKEFDPRLAEKRRSFFYDALKSIWAWFLSNIVAKVLVGVIVALVLAYLAKSGLTSP